MPYKAHLAKDKKLKKLVDTIVLPELKAKRNIFIELVGSIASQQLSVKVAAVIFDRFLQLYGGKKPTPQQVLETPHEDLRGIGFSNQKVTYVKNIAQFAVDHNLSYAYINKMSNEELIPYLTQIKGVGQWTVEMLMMFTLARADVFSVGDYGLQMGVKKLYNIDDSNKKIFLQNMEKISKKWVPYRTYASLYLWRYKDGE
jgi:DNA-3-methyladenine glycosylase II